MWNSLRQLLRVTPRSEAGGKARPARLRPSVELLESRALLSVAPAGPVGWFELGNQTGAGVQLPAAYDVSVAISFSGAYQFPTGTPVGGNAAGSLTLTDTMNFMPDPAGQEGGMVDLGGLYPTSEGGDLYSSQPTDTISPDTSDPLPTLQYMPRSVPLGTAANNVPGSVAFGEAATISTAAPADAAQRATSSSTTSLLDSMSKSVPPGQSEKASVEANHGATRLPVAESSTQRQDEESNGGMIILPREPVVDESADNSPWVQDEDPATLEMPLEVERTYGRFQAFEVSTAEEIGAGLPHDDEAACSTPPTEQHGNERATPILKSAAHREQAVDALFALASSVDETLDQDDLLEGTDAGIAGVIADAPAVDLQLAKSTDDTREASLSPSRALSTLPVSTAAAAAVFVAITRTTRRPRRQVEGIDRE